MKTKSMYLITLLALLVLVSGCATSGMFLSSNNTNVELSKPNFKIVATDLKGESTASYLFGVSYSFGAATETIALIKVDGTGQLYKEALENLWGDYRQKYGNVEGKKLALVNVRYDADVVNALVFTKVNISVRADVVEFVE